MAGYSVQWRVVPEMSGGWRWEVYRLYRDGINETIIVSGTSPTKDMAVLLAQQNHQQQLTLGA